jgi:hypothetical protein
MAHDIIGDWEVTHVEKGASVVIGRITFSETDGRLVVTDSDPDEGGAVSRVEVEGETLRFEHLGGGSSRGTVRHVFEVVMQGPAEFAGTRRRGMLPRTPVTGQRVPDPLDALAGNLAGAKARAAEAAERAALAAAEAEAAFAEAEAAAALEAARRAAQKALAARAAATTQAAEAQVPQLVVPPEVLAIIPAPAQPAVAGSAPAPAAPTMPPGEAPASAQQPD